MINIPGTPDAAYLSFAIVDELINVLVGKGVLTTTDRHTLLMTVESRVSEDGRSVAKTAAEVVRQAIAKSDLK